MRWHRWILLLSIIYGSVQSKPVLELAHVYHDNGTEYVKATLRGSDADTVRFEFSCSPQLKIIDYHKVATVHQTAQTYSTIYCSQYIKVKAITKNGIFTDSLNVGLIRQIIAKNRPAAQK